MPQILSKQLDQVIIVDTDLLVLTDVQYLWSLCTNLRKSSATTIFGWSSIRFSAELRGNNRLISAMTENQSIHYLRYNVSNIPGEMGLNSGVILVLLDRLRQLDWTSMWRTNAIELLEKKKVLQTADQDVYTAG